MISAAALALSACASKEDVQPLASPEVPVAEASASPQQEAPIIKWGSTGHAYHHIWGDCEFLSYGHGRNAAWGRWRLPLTEVVAGEIASDGYEGFQITYTCEDGSACIQSGQLEETPNRITELTIPFASVERTEQWLSDVTALETTCAAPR